ncbi:hypothetical protein [Sporofaciens sp. JLR.KK001]|uniref:hypothetical protein n=1 Tax=Sporofaciens sp. JLR.KK001 TaxID=3112621 RepID=UPI002FEF8BE5
MKRNKLVVAMDELPLSKEKGECEDYGSILFWKWVGKSAFGKDVNIKVIDNKIVPESVNLT